MTRVRRPRVLSSSLLVAALLALAPAPAAMAEPSTPPSPADSPSPAAQPPAPADSRATFGVRPSGPSAPDNRSTFTYGATPAGVLTDQVEVSNASEQPLTLRLYASDAFNPRGGGFDLLAAGRKPVDVGSWVAMSQDTVTVPGRSNTIVPFRLSIPADATPGDHSGGIVASLMTEQTTTKGEKVTVDQRVGARIFLRVSGNLHPGLTVEGLRATFRPSANPFGSGRATVTYAVRNNGNVRLGARHSLSISTPWGQRIIATAGKDLADLLPGNEIEVTTEVGGLPPALLLNARVHADPGAPPGDVDPPLHPVQREAGFWAASWTEVALIVLVVGGAVAWVLVRRRRRSGGRPATATGSGHEPVPAN